MSIFRNCFEAEEAPEFAFQKEPRVTLLQGRNSRSHINFKQHQASLPNKLRRRGRGEVGVLERDDYQ